MTKSLAATDNAGLSPALDYIDAHANDSVEWWHSPLVDAVHREHDDEDGAPGGAAEAKVSRLAARRSCDGARADAELVRGNSP